MKLTELKQALLERSDFTSPNGLATYTNQTQPFTAAFIQGTKAASEKEDILFDALTECITIDEFIAALELVLVVRQQQIEREQIL